MPFLPEILLPARLGKSLFGGCQLLAIDFRKALIINDIIVRLHHGQADVRLGLTLLGAGDEQSGLGDFVVVHSLKTVEERVTGAHAVGVMERRGSGIDVGLRVDGSAEIVTGVCAGAD